MTDQDAVVAGRRPGHSAGSFGDGNLDVARGATSGTCATTLWPMRFPASKDREDRPAIRSACRRSRAGRRPRSVPLGSAGLPAVIPTTSNARVRCRAAARRGAPPAARARPTNPRRGVPDGQDLVRGRPGDRRWNRDAKSANGRGGRNAGEPARGVERCHPRETLVHRRGDADDARDCRRRPVRRGPPTTATMPALTVSALLQERARASTISPGRGSVSARDGAGLPAGAGAQQRDARCRDPIRRDRLRQGRHHRP